MNFDRNTIIGFVILAILFFGFFYYNNQQQIAAQKEQLKKDSIAKASQPKPDTSVVKRSVVPVVTDTNILNGDSSLAFNQFKQGVEQITEIENDLLKIGFTNKGGQPKWVELKKLYNAKKIGICNNAGIQPPNGFTPASRKSFICSMLIAC